jgi:hypothetical protein
VLVGESRTEPPVVRRRHNASNKRTNCIIFLVGIDLVRRGLQIAPID